MMAAATGDRAERDRITAIFDAQIEGWEAAAGAERLSPRLRDDLAAMAVAGRILLRTIQGETT